MIRTELKLRPEEYHTDALLRAAAARKAEVPVRDIGTVRVVRRSLDSRRGIHYIADVEVYMTGEPLGPRFAPSEYHDSRQGGRLVIVGAGPAGLFGALRALELGWKPIIVERGKAVEQRKKDITAMVRAGQVNESSNWCYGEGGAGTYSDGKLFTRSTKRGDVGEVLRKLVEHGAEEEILIDTHAHIGTDRLSGIMANIRKTILEHGGEYLFEKQVVDFIFSSSGNVRGVRCKDGSTVEGEAVVLATGHSARDIYELFAQRGWALESKPFALGVRVEHPQALINEIQYHGPNYSRLLPAAAYSIKTQVEGRGVFSFCMCPGGVIVPAATAYGEQVVNGMSNASRSSAFANSGIAVTVSAADAGAFGAESPLDLLRFQQNVERKAFASAGGGLKAPAQRLVDFCENKGASQLNKSNYMGECVAVALAEVLPRFVATSLQQAFRDFGRKMHGFYTNEASVLAVESRTSSPVRIPRDDHGEHLTLKGLYPCGEGAGYAGGIVSSAIDGMKAVEHATGIR